MKSFAVAALAGALGLPATYSLTREGSILLSLLVVALLGALGGALAVASRGGRTVPHLGFFVLAFVVGAALSEAAAFLRYYTAYGHEDPKLSVGVALSLIELCFISAIGSITLLVAASQTRYRLACSAKARAV